VYKNVSWESHMLGFFSGAFLAVWYRNQGPQQPVYEWMDETDEEKTEGNGERENLKDEGNNDEETEGLRDGGTNPFMKTS
jgi:hypothetical protein